MYKVCVIELHSIGWV